MAASYVFTMVVSADYPGRAKKRFQSLLREQIRAIVASDEDVGDELRGIPRYFK